MSRASLSACLISKNGAAFLPHVLANIESLVDEIVVVDDFSSDGTVDLLETHPKVRLFQRPFRNFGSQKNLAFDQARGDWILSLDQDELLGDRLRAAIPRLVQTDRYTHYKMPRYWLLSGPPWRFVDSDKHYPNWMPRLFRNTPFFRYATDQIVHHHFPRKGRGPCRRLRGQNIFHFHFIINSRPEREERVRFYSRLDPRALTTHGMLLYEQYDFRCRRCREPLTAPGLVGTTAMARPMVTQEPESLLSRAAS